MRRRMRRPRRCWRGSARSRRRRPRRRRPARGSRRSGSGSGRSRRRGARSRRSPGSSRSSTRRRMPRSRRWSPGWRRWRRGSRRSGVRRCARPATRRWRGWRRGSRRRRTPRPQAAVRLGERLSALERAAGEARAEGRAAEDAARAEAQAIAEQLIALRTAAVETELFADRLALLEASLPRLSAAQAEMMQALERQARAAGGPVDPGGRRLGRGRPARGLPRPAGGLAPPAVTAGCTSCATDSSPWNHSETMLAVNPFATSADAPPVNPRLTVSPDPPGRVPPSQRGSFPVDSSAADTAPAALNDLIAAGLVSHEVIGDPARLGAEAETLRTLCGLVTGPVWRVGAFHYAFRAQPEDLGGTAGGDRPGGLERGARDRAAGGARPGRDLGQPGRHPRRPPGRRPRRAAPAPAGAGRGGGGAPRRRRGPEPPSAPLQAVISARYAAEVARLTAGARRGAADGRLGPRSRRR